MRKALLLAAAMITPVTAAYAKKKPLVIWEVSRSSDPITGDTSCIVAPFDRAAGMSFTRSAAHCCSGRRVPRRASASRTATSGRSAW